MDNKEKAYELHEKAEVLMGENQDDEALELLLEAVLLDSSAWASFYDIGLIYKYRQDWEKSLEYNLKAFDIEPDDEAVCWNTAIAATALEKWDIARKVWQHLGIDVGDGQGEILQNFGQTPVRLNPDDDGEVVWATRVCPVRAQINNIPFPDSGFGYQDIVLHDGAGVGERVVNGMTFPVFNVFCCQTQSEYDTFEVEVTISSDDDMVALDHLSEKHDCAMEDWTQSVNILCKECSEGTPHEHHNNDADNEWQPKRNIGFAARTKQDVNNLLALWSKQTQATYTLYD